MKDLPSFVVTDCSETGLDELNFVVFGLGLEVVAVGHRRGGRIATEPREGTGSGDGE
jgi:hypothetical protein